MTSDPSLGNSGGGGGGSGGPQAQSDSQREYVRQRYLQDKLYITTDDYSGGLMMDLPLARGVMVGVIKEGDPMGNKDRWYIDNGGESAFDLFVLVFGALFFVFCLGFGFLVCIDFLCSRQRFRAQKDPSVIFYCDILIPNHSTETECSFRPHGPGSLWW